MKIFFFSFMLIFFSATLFAQETLSESITHNSLQRDYILYVPSSYNGEEAVPLVFNFHGFTSNATEQLWYGDFKGIADTANFLVVHPEGTLLNGVTHFNVGGFTLGSTVDDVGFAEALIDSLSAKYNINQERIYSTGMSNGGFMSYLLACQLSDRIAAVASVTGSMTPGTYNNCDPQHPTPVMQIHGTLDPTVAYGGSVFSKSIDEVMAYWSNYNNCDETAIITPIPDINTDDGSTVDHFLYANGDEGATTELFKVYSGEHTWPGSLFTLGTTNRDINASKEIWDFFSRYDINGLIQTTNISKEITANTPRIDIYPNPAENTLKVYGQGISATNFIIHSTLGEIVKQGKFSGDAHSIDLSSLAPNIYILNTGTEVIRFVKN